MTQSLQETGSKDFHFVSNFLPLCSLRVNFNSQTQEKYQYSVNNYFIAFCFCWLKAHLVCSDHRKALGYKIGATGPGRNGRRPCDRERWPTTAESHWDAPRQPAAVNRPPGAAGVRHVTGGRCPPGPDYMGRQGGGEDS